MTELSKKAYTYAAIIYGVFFAYSWYLFYSLGLFVSKHYLSDNVSSVFSIQNNRFYTLNMTASGLITFVLILGLFFNKKLRTFLIDVGDEISRVSYPTFKEARKKTLLVIGLVIVASIFLFLFDLAFMKLMRFLLSTATS